MSRLLLVDDDHQLLHLYELVLHQAGHQVRTAENGHDAVMTLVEFDPEIVIVDLHIPEMEDGLTLLRALRNHQRPSGQPPLKVIVTSGWTDDLPGGAERESVSRVLPKPVRTEVLLRLIAELA